MEHHTEEPREHQPQPEDGHRHPDQRPDASEAVQDGPPPDGGDDADRNAPEQRQDDGGGRELHRGGEPAQDVGQHRVAANDGRPEVAAQDLAHVEEVLLVDRPVEPELLPDGVGALGGGPLAEHGGGRVAGDQMDEAEDENGHPEEDGDDGEAAPNGVVPHRLPFFLGARALLNFDGVEELRPGRVRHVPLDLLRERRAGARRSPRRCGPRHRGSSARPGDRASPARPGSTGWPPASERPRAAGCCRSPPAARWSGRRRSRRSCRDRRCHRSTRSCRAASRPSSASRGSWPTPRSGAAP